MGASKPNVDINENKINNHLHCNIGIIFHKFNGYVIRQGRVAVHMAERHVICLAG